MRRRFNWIYIGLALLLLVAVCFLWDMHVNKKEITGTFSTGKDLCGSGLYISFFPRGEYLIYRQDEDIQNGSYSCVDLDGNVVVKLISSGEPQYVAVFNKKNSILLIDTNTYNIFELSRISRTPMIVGHKPDYSKIFDFDIN